MEKDRFSLLQLEPGEIYFEDFSVIFVPANTKSATYDTNKQDGRLKMCSRSLIFDPKDLSKPMLKIHLKDCVIIEQWKGSSSFINANNVLAIHCKDHVEMYEKNIIAPYKFKGFANFLFILNYANISNCLPQICQLHRASTLPPVEQADMIATIVHSRQARIAFDLLWLDLYEKVVIEFQADKITPLVVNPGRLLLSTSAIYFQPYNNIEEKPVIKLDLSSIKRIIKRRFLLRHIGLEIYSTQSNNNPYIYLSFANQNDRENFYRKLIEQPNLKLSEMEQNVMTLQWQNGIISNYDYLLYINSLGDRTINDLTQYPVFPWILSDYMSCDLDLSDCSNYRDLSKPVGALNEQRLEKLLDRYNEMSEPKFLYGSHYSTPGFVLFYLARLYPHYVLCLQSGRFDHPDRMFNSMVDVYRNCLSNMSDFKELIPEFFDVSKEGTFLVNDKGINFGYRHNGLKVGDVELPPWAKNPADFVSKMRDALESDVVSQKLHLWIDLIFGFKQQGEQAIKANNLYYYLCYEGSMELDSITDLNARHALEVQIMEFGQVPKQVFKVPHPQRKIGCVLLKEPYDINDTVTFKENLYQFTDLDLLATFGSHRGPIGQCFISEDKNFVYSVGHDYKLKVFSIPQKKQIRSSNIGSMPLSSCIKLPNLNILVIGSWDNQIILYDLDYGRITESVLAHEDAITCMCWGKKLNVLISGSGDCTLRIWKGFSDNGVIKPIQCLFKQIDLNSPVNCITFDIDNRYVAAGIDDGEVHIWETENFSLFRKFQLSSSSIKTISYSPDGLKLAVGSADREFKIIDVTSGMPMFVKVFDSYVVSSKWNEFLLVLGCESGIIMIWNIIEVKLLVELEAHQGKVLSIDIAEDNSLICTGGEDHKIKVWCPKK